MKHIFTDLRASEYLSEPITVPSEISSLVGHGVTRHFKNRETLTISLPPSFPTIHVTSRYRIGRWLGLKLICCLTMCQITFYSVVISEPLSIADQRGIMMSGFSNITEKLGVSLKRCIGYSCKISDPSFQAFLIFL